MTQQVIDPVEQQSFPQPPGHERVESKSFYSFLTVVIALLVILASLVIISLPQVTHYSNPSVQSIHPLQGPGGTTLSSMNVTTPGQLIYAQPDHIYTASTLDGSSHPLTTPGYLYSRSVPPRLTPSGELLYSGDGVWLLNLASGQSRQLATLLPGQLITATALSQDGQTLAWSSMPADGNGNLNFYAGPLTATTLVYQQRAGQCPCLRLYSFLEDTAHSNTTLLLTNDRGDKRLVQYGLWSLDVTHAPAAQPQLLFSDDAQQGPLALAPQQNTLLYSSYEGFVPPPGDGSAPHDINSLSYANSLLLTTISGSPPQMGSSREILPLQREQPNSATYHWVTSPLFSQDGRTLVYIVFTSDVHQPFSRHSALYTVPASVSSTVHKSNTPRLLATAITHYIELGGWLNDHTLTFYTNNALYALDIQLGAVAQITQTSGYAHIIGFVPQGHP